MQDFQEFHDLYMPRIRPEGLIKRVRYALQIDSTFAGAFGALSRDLRRELEFWPDKIVLQLMQFRKLDDKFGDEQMKIMRQLFRRHRAAILANRFENNYFTSIEALTIFFIYHDIRMIWVVGAFKKAIKESIEGLSEQRDTGRTAVIFPMMTFLILELNQIQRVYVRYAELTGTLGNTRDTKYTLAG